jgi:hypothetical protein
MTGLHPRDHGEAVAHFRHAIIGALSARDLSRGELAVALRALTQQRHRPPEADGTRSYSVPTLERWYYAFRTGGMDALRPAARSDRGPRARSGRRASDPALRHSPRAPGRLGPAHLAHAPPVRSASSCASKDSIVWLCATARDPRRDFAGKPHCPMRSGKATSATDRRSCWGENARPSVSMASSTITRAISSRWKRTRPSARTTCSDFSSARYASTENRIPLLG